MAVVTHGVSANTAARLLIDAGAVYLGWTSVAAPGTLLGATKDGNTFELDRRFIDVRPDGSIGPIKGFRRRDEIIGKLTVNLMEITEANLLVALPGATAAAHVITGGELADADFIDKVAIVGNITGFTMTSAPAILVVENALVEGPFSVKMSPKGEAVIQLVFVAHFLSTALSTEPWSITYPS